MQINHIVSIRESLTNTAEQWQGVNEDPESKRNLTMDKESQLKHQLKKIRANRVKLGEIAANCQRAVKHRVYKEEPLEKAEFFRKKWMDTLEKEKKIRQQLKDVQQQKREVNRQFKAASRQMPPR